MLSLTVLPQTSQSPDSSHLHYFDWLIDFRERGVGRDKHQCVIPLIYVFIVRLLYVP